MMNQLRRSIDHKCRICGQQGQIVHTGKVLRKYSFYQCCLCKTVFAIYEPENILGDLSNTYDQLFSQGEYEQHRIEFEQLCAGKLRFSYYRKRFLQRIEKMIKGRDVVEIGGGTGSFGYLCSLRGWNYLDLDISRVAVEYVKKLNLNARVITINDLHLKPQSADLIVMWEVIEHLWNVSDYLDVIRTSLRDNGVLLMSTPNYLRLFYQEKSNWEVGAMPPIHVNFFAQKSIQNVLQIKGFSKIQIRKPRLHKPSSLKLKDIITSMRVGLYLDQPQTLYVIARKG